VFDPYTARAVALTAVPYVEAYHEHPMIEDAGAMDRPGSTTAALAAVRGDRRA